MQKKLILVAPIFCDLQTFNHTLYERSKDNDYLEQNNQNIVQSDLGNKDDLWMDEAQIFRNKTTGEKLKQRIIPIDLSKLLEQNGEVVPLNAVLFYRDGDYDDRNFLCLVVEAYVNKDYLFVYSGILLITTARFG